MRINFTPDQLSDRHLQAAAQQLRACVHCGICTATCPTYVLLGDELDGPRGRIQLIQQMLETDATPGATVVRHIDRCLSCLACVSACPSGVNYPRLIDEARHHIEEKASRPWPDRWLRWLLGRVLPSRKLLRPMLAIGRHFVALRPLLPVRLGALVETAARISKPKARLPAPLACQSSQVVALHAGCVQEVIAPHITIAARRVLARLNIEVAIVEGTGCCGSINHHLGQSAQAKFHADALVADITARETVHAFDAVVTTASGCGASIRDLGFQLGNDKAASIGQRTQDIMHLLQDRNLQPTGAAHMGTIVAWHAACSLTHGMKQGKSVPQFLRRLGYDVVEPTDTSCCGSAGVYSVLQPEISGQLQNRKASALSALKPQLIASGNIGCIAQIAAAMTVPVVHPIELVDWAMGGPAPSAMG